MRYDELVKKLGELSTFDLPTVVQLFDEKRGTIRVQLHRWCQAGKLLSLRRGMYAFPPTRGSIPNPATVANALYTPSYITAQWTLSFNALIPERTVTYTCVTTRRPAEFTNVLGTFRYRHIKPQAFFGYQTMEILGSKVLVAEPQKALLDFLYLEPGPWTEARMMGMRFQNTEQIDPDRLRFDGERFNCPRIKRAVDIWLGIRDQEVTGSRNL